MAFEAYRLSLGGEPAPGDRRADRRAALLPRAGRRRGGRKHREARAIRLLAIDPHSPDEFRCNIVSNLAEFHEAFDVQPGDGMWREPEDRVVIW